MGIAAALGVLQKVMPDVLHSKFAAMGHTILVSEARTIKCESAHPGGLWDVEHEVISVFMGSGKDR